MITLKEDLDAYVGAYTEDFKFYEENTRLLYFYASRILEKIQAIKPNRVLSLGIGYGVVNRCIAECLNSISSRYTIIDGSQKIIDSFRATTPQHPNIECVRSYFETFIPTHPFDVIEMGFVLEHVDDPFALLCQYRNFLAKDAIVFVAVPNALSLHRRVGHLAGLLPDLYSLSEHDRALGHKRSFDPEILRQLCESAGFRIQAIEGLMLKPLTTAQMKTVALPENIIASFDSIARLYPELSNSLLAILRAE